MCPPRPALSLQAPGSAAKPGAEARRQFLRATARMATLSGAALALTGCGFRLRSSQAMPFDSIAVTPEGAGGVVADLTRYLGSAVRPLAGTPAEGPPQVILDVLQETREKTVAAVNASGQVREFQLRLVVRVRLRTPQGQVLIAPVDIEQQRDISFNESAVLAKEAEEALLVRDMQSDVVQQILRRLAATRLPAAR